MFSTVRPKGLASWLTMLVIYSALLSIIRIRRQQKTSQVKYFILISRTMVHTRFPKCAQTSKYLANGLIAGYSNNPRPTVLQHGSAHSPNFPHAYQVASSVSTSNSSVRASSPATQYETEVATPFDFQTPSENFNHTTWDTAEVGGQFQ